MAVQQLPFATRASSTRRALERRTRVADQIVTYLEATGVEYVFGLPGGPISPLNDALLDSAKIESITAKHENGAMYAAAGYARATGQPGVVLVTSGPGILNGLCGLASAHCDGAPIVVLVGEVPSKNQGRNALQDGSAHHLDILSMVRSVCKDAMQVPDARTALTAISRAMRVAKEGKPGPVVLTLPMDVLIATAPMAEVSIAAPDNAPETPLELSRAVRLTLERSRSGVIFAGSGVRTGEGPRLLHKLAERLDWPVMTTPKGKGVFPESHPLSLGVFGAGGHPSTAEHLNDGFETILAIGTSLGDLSTDGWSPLLNPQRSFIHVDLDPTNVTANYDLTTFIEASAASFCKAALSALRNTKPRPSIPKKKAVGLAPAGERIRRHRDPETSDTGPSGQITPERAVWEIQLSLEEDTCFLLDSGEHYLYGIHYLNLNRPDALIAQSGLGAMGASVGAGLGAQLGFRGRRVAVICGDGGFTMSGSDVATAVATSQPVLYFVFDDARLGMVEHGHGDLYGRSPTFTPEDVDLAKFGRSLGAGAVRVSLPGEIMRLDYRRLTANGRRPGVIVVAIDPSCRMPRNTRTATMSKGDV